MSRPPVRVQAPPGGWGDAVRQEEPSEYGDLVDAIYDNAILNENLNSEQEALEQAYDILIEKGTALGMQSLYNPYREDQSGEQRQPLGSAARYLWQQPNDSMEGTPFGHESPGVRWKALEFENRWRSEAVRLGDKAEAEGGQFEASLDEGSRLAVVKLSTTLRQDSLRRLEAIKEARGEGFWSFDTLTEFGVSMGAAMNDPAQVATLFVAAPEALGAKSVLVAGAKEAAVNVTVEAALQPGIQASKLDAGVIDNWQQAVGDGLANVGVAGALGFTFGATGKLIDNKLFAPGRERTEAFRALARDIEGVRFDDDAVQRSVMRMIGEVVETEGPIQPSQAMADALRETAAKATDPAAAARLSTVASEIERALQPEEDPDAKFARAREAMGALSRMTEDADPESAAIVRKALYEAEKDYATARQRPDTVPMDEFAEAIEAADAQVRALREFGSRPEPALPEPTARALDITDDAPSPSIGARLDEDGKPVTFTRFDPRKLGTAPEEFQYKRYNGAEGVNGAIEDVGVWHAPSSGKVMVFERANGEQIIADGHQRRGKAVALMARDGREDIWLDGYLYKESDGWTVSDIRKKAAQKNIREGRSDVLDTAQALRESPDAIDASFPVSRSNIGQARKLARLSPEAWDLTRAGILEPQYAALIGAVAPDRPDMHAPLARTLIEAGPDNVRQAENIISEALMDYAERNVSEQPSLFGDDGLGRAVMYRERAQIMDATYAALRSERSVFKALVDNGDIARAIGNELVDQANLTAKDQVDLAIAAIMHARRSGIRTAVSDMISRALDSVRREGLSPNRAGQQVAREVRALVEAKGFRALLDAEGPRPPELAEAGPLFDKLNSPEHIAQADMLEASLRPEGREAPDLDLAKVATIKDEAAGAKKSGDPLKAAQTEFRQYMQAEDALRDALAGLTDAQKVALVRIQYPDAFPQLNRMEGAELDDAIVGRVMAGEFKSARREGGEIKYNRFQSALLNASENKIVEMALNGMPNLDIAVEMGFGVKSVQVILSRAQKKLRDGGEPVTIERGQSGPALDGFAPGDLRRAVFEILDSGADVSEVMERLAARGMNTNPGSVSSAVSRWRAAQRKGVKFARGDAPILLQSRVFSPGQPDDLGFITSAERALANPPGRFRDAKALSPEQWRKWMREGGASKEAFTYQIEPALRALADEGLTGDIPKAKFEEALARARGTLTAEVTAPRSKGSDLQPILAEQSYDQYVAPGKATNYRQEVLLLPPEQGQGYKSHNWNSENPVGHIRTTDRVAADGTKVRHVEELQSDLHQEGARSGYRGEAGGAEDTSRSAKQARDDFTTAVENFQTWKESLPRDEQHRLPNHFDRNFRKRPPNEDIDDATGRELYRELQAKWDRAKAAQDGIKGGTSPPRAPLEKWEEPFVRHALQQAARDGIDTVTFTTHATLHRALQNEGTKKFYDERLPNTLARVAKSLGLNVESVRLNVGTKIDKLVNDGLMDPSYRYNPADDKALSSTVPAIRLTPEAKAKLAEGVVMYSQGDGPSPAGMTPTEALDRLKAEFGDSAGALTRIGEVNIADIPPAWMAPSTQGITDAQGRVTLYSANVTPDSLRGLVLHEIGVHVGMRQVLGEAGFEGVLAQIDARLAADDKSVAVARSRVPSDTDPATVREETLAYLIQHAPRHGIVQQVIADIRAWLYKTFPQLRDHITLTDADLQSLAMGAVRRRIREADWSTPLNKTAAGATFVEPIRASRGASDEFGLPIFQSGYEPRDLILMYVDGVDYGRMAVELSLAAQRTIPQSSIETRATYVRTALRALQKDPERYAAAADSMAVTTDVLDLFVSDIGKRRAPSIRAEARRLIESGETDTKAIIAAMRDYASRNRLEYSEASLPQTVSQMRREVGLARPNTDTASTPAQREAIIALRLKGKFPDEIARETGANLGAVRFTINNARVRGVEFPRLPAGKRGPFSTGPIKYARDEDGFRNRETRTSRDAGRGDAAAGRDGGTGRAGNGPAAAGGRAGLGSVQPVRAMASEPIPSPQFVEGYWNAAIALTPQQRVERRQQFREFVDSAEVQYEPTKFSTTWAFKNGKRYEGAPRVVESRRYSVRRTDDMHPEWREVLEPEETGLTVEIHGKEATIHDSHVAFELRSTGLGQKIYAQAIDDMLAQGLVVNSDVSVSPNAIALWKSFRKSGYDVVQRVPDALLELGDDGQYSHANSSTAVFFIAGRKPRAPDLPQTERDVMNRIDDERALADHMPKCLKGKGNG